MALPQLTDLDTRPELASSTLAALAAAGPGSHHLIIGLPHRMGLPPVAEDLRHCLGVLLAVRSTRLHGILALCPYSREQATLWGPTQPDADADGVAALLMHEARRALRRTGFESMRIEVDQRNRSLRAFALSHGFIPWKDNLVFQRALSPVSDPDPRVRLCGLHDRPEVVRVLTTAFPDSDHCSPSLATRERQGYRHYLLAEGEQVLGAAAVRSSGQRTWMKLLAVAESARRRGIGRRLLAGVAFYEQQRGASDLALEVLADNRSAIGLYQRMGFVRQWLATIMTAPL